MVKASHYALIVFICALLALAGTSRGEDGTGQDSTSVDTTGAASDTLPARPRDSEAGFHPQYGSQYTVNKQARNWGQSFGLNEQIGPFLVTNSTNMTMSRDQNRGNRRTRIGSSNGTATIDIGWGLSAGLTADLSKSTALDRTTRTEDNSTSGGFSMSYTKSGGPLQTSFTGSAGVVRKDVYGEALFQQNKPREGIVTAARIDSTRAMGTSLSLTGMTIYKPIHKLSSTANFAMDRSRLDSDIFVFWRTQGADDSSSTSRSPNSNGNWTASLKTEYAAATASKITLDLRTANRRNEYYLVQEGTENSRNIANSATLDVAWKLPLDVGGQAQVYRRRTDQSYARLVDKGATNDDQGFSLGGSRRLPFAVDASTNFSTSLRKNSYYVKQLTRNDVRSREMRGSLKRIFSPRFSMAATGVVGLTSFFYHPSQALRDSLPDEYDKRQAQDRDDYRRQVELSILYKPGPRYDTSLVLQKNDRKSVYVKSRSSGNTTQNERYQILASLTYTWSTRTTITQRYSIAADYSYFIFNESGNSLTRESKVQTEIRSKLTDRTELDLQHDFRFRDSGSYSRSAPDAPRLYGRSLEDTQQDLQVQTRYSLYEDVSLQLRQRIETRNALSLESHTRTTSKRLELVEGVEFNHGFKSGLGLRGTFNRTDSYLEQTGVPIPRKEKFWVIEASLNKAF